MPEEDLKPNPRFLKAMHDPGHPDFGLSFSAAVELAMAKEKEAITLASTHGWWATDGDDAEATVENANGPDESAAGTPVESKAVTAVEDAAKPTAATTTRRSGRQAAEKAALPASSSSEKGDTSNTLLPKKSKPSTAQPPPKANSSSEQPTPTPKKLTLKLTKKSTASASSQSQQSATAPLPPSATPRSSRIKRITVAPKYDPVSFDTAEAMQDLGLDFGDMRVVEWYNRQMQGEDTSRPYRNQNSLLQVTSMTKEEYFGV